MKRVGWAVAATSSIVLGIVAMRYLGWFSSAAPVAEPVHEVRQVQYQPSSSERIARKTDLRYLQCQPRHWRYCVLPH